MTTTVTPLTIAGVLHVLVATLIVLGLPAVPGRTVDDDPVSAAAIHVVLPPRLVFLPTSPPGGGGGGNRNRVRSAALKA